MGEFDDDLTTILMDINDAGKSDMKASRKKMSYLIAECFQNIIRHSDKKNRVDIKEDIPEMFILRDKNTVHHIVTTNLIANKYITGLKDKLDSLQDLSAEELKELYMKVFELNAGTERGGAGLGLIDMARKSGVAPAYEFIDLGNGYSNFFMQVNVLPKNFSGQIDQEDLSIHPALNIYEKMTREKVLILQKGDFSQDAVLPLIQLFENNLNLRDEHIGLAKRVLYILIEMLQNMTRHAETISSIREGIFLITEPSVKAFEISTGNYISSSDAEQLKKQLDEIAEMDKISLSKKYKQKLMEDDDTSGHKGAGLGLIELCRHSSEKINYDIRPLENGLSFFSLHVKV